MKTDLDALLTALYVHLDDDVIPSAKQARGPGRPRLLTDAELICVAVAQVLLRCDDERRWLRVAPARIGHLFPRLPGQSEYNRHLARLAPHMLTAIGWLARHTPTWHDNLRLMDGTPVPCGASRTTVERSGLGEMCGYGRDASHHRFYWGSKLVLVTTAEGTVTAFSLAHPKELDERKQALHLLHAQECAPGPCPIVCDKGFAGAGIEQAATDLGHVLIRPRRKDEPKDRARVFPGWLRQRIEAIIWTLKNQLGLERHNARTTEGLWARVCQRILALNAAIWHNWQIGAPIKRSLVAYDH
ncbi:DDE family transposase [Nocardiopsis sp. Huas11]|uniref:transposase n=1 Tax=Nocardiopsis sp. Huas11 TaxID=2183912 RepID=UPI000EAC0A1E|nr:transposase [Nocardiopsis sp. Huas11]RKS05082.1 DDE family transposase [Nocardiopsis sp. Huas11]RKS05161.1 DDE family transposase [Nocardiopsis sp. Huas11]RKS05974.1 DDE family transposase [Nocardiopsis sp. Huas11]RKS06277.1 DDE family transposase [Nocardiopsis sp. Huas11]RKS07450.1 DDE family transposase [Nocardiopsis sp. Huas11]